jgi:hypothetical protein
LRGIGHGAVQAGYSRLRSSVTVAWPWSSRPASGDAGVARACRAGCPRIVFPLRTVIWTPVALSDVLPDCRLLGGRRPRRGTGSRKVNIHSRTVPPPKVRVKSFS